MSALFENSIIRAAVEDAALTTWSPVWQPSWATEALERVREIITNGWCKLYLATYSNGMPCSPLSPDMKRCCLSGGIKAAAATEGVRLTDRIVSAILFKVVHKAGAYPFWSIAQANDDPGTTHEMVIGWVDRAIALSKELEQIYPNLPSTWEK
jgi:hypothetical protein